MSKAKAVTTVAGPTDSDMDDELDSAEPNQQISPDSNQENKIAPGKKGRPRGKAASARFTKTKAPGRRISGGAMVGKRKAAPKKRAVGKRAPLKEQTNVQRDNDTEDVDNLNAQPTEEADPIEDASMDEQPPAIVPPERKKPATRGKKATAKEPKPQPKAIEKDGEFEYTPIRTVDNGLFSKVTANKDAPIARGTTKAREIAETQPEPMDIDLPRDSDVDEDAIPQSFYRQTSNLRATSKTRQPPVNRKRAGSASDTEGRNNDPALRRKIGDMTKKVESLEMRYNNLREVGVKEAEANFERLKVHSENNAKGKHDDHETFDKH